MRFTDKELFRRHLRQEPRRLASLNHLLMLFHLDSGRMIKRSSWMSTYTATYFQAQAYRMTRTR